MNFTNRRKKIILIYILLFLFEVAKLEQELIIGTMYNKSEKSKE